MMDGLIKIYAETVSGSDQDSEELDDQINYIEVGEPWELDEAVEQYGDGSFYHVDKDGERNFYIGHRRLTDNFNAGKIMDGVKTKAVGGLKPTTMGNLKGKSMSELMIEILCPNEIPEIPVGKPSVSISGRILYAEGDSPDLDGIKVISDSGKFGNGETYAGKFSETVREIEPELSDGKLIEGKYKVVVSGDFAEGGVPHDTYGNEIAELRYGGGSGVAEMEIHCVKPVKMTADMSSMKIDGERMDITIFREFDIDYFNTSEIYVITPQETQENKFRINLPVGVNMSVRQFNGLTEKYDIDPEMVIDSKTDDADGYVKYVRTTNSNDVIVKEAKYKIELSK